MTKKTDSLMRDDGTRIDPEQAALLVRERELLGRDGLTAEEQAELRDVQDRIWDGPQLIAVREKLGFPPRNPDPSKRHVDK